MLDSGCVAYRACVTLPPAISLGSATRGIAGLHLGNWNVGITNVRCAGCLALIFRELVTSYIQGGHGLHVLLQFSLDCC